MILNWNNFLLIISAILFGLNTYFDIKFLGLFFALTGLFVILKNIHGTKNDIIKISLFFWLSSFIYCFWAVEAAQNNFSITYTTSFIFILVLSVVQGLNLSIPLIIFCRVKYIRESIFILPFIVSAMEYYFPILIPTPIGASLTPLTPFLGLANITGVSGYSFIIVMVSLMLKKSLSSNKAKIGLFLFLIISASLSIIYPQKKSPILRNGKLLFHVVQPSISNIKRDAISNKSEDSLKKAINSVNKMISEIEKSAIILFPETLAPQIMDPQNKERYLNLIFPSLTERNVILGNYLYSSSQFNNKYNSLTQFNNGKYIEHYNKKIFMPITEEYPLGLEYLLGAKDNLIKGDKFRNFTYQYNDYLLSILPKICVEDLYSRETRNHHDSLHGDLLVIHVDDNWIGKEGARYHLIGGLWRGLELDIPYIRVANNGPSVLIDTDGTIINKIPYNTKSIFSFSVNKDQDYERSVFSRFGFLIIFIAGSILILVEFLINMRTKYEY